MQSLFYVTRETNKMMHLIILNSNFKITRKNNYGAYSINVLNKNNILKYILLISAKRY